MSKILILESDRLLANNIAKFLAGRGHSATCVVEPQAAVLAADTDCPDAVILDLFLASRGGLEFLYEFRTYADWKNVPAVIFTSLPVAELASCADELEHLNIHAFCHKAHTSLAQLAGYVEQALAPAHA